MALVILPNTRLVINVINELLWWRLTATNVDDFFATQPPIANRPVVQQATHQRVEWLTATRLESAKNAFFGTFRHVPLAGEVWTCVDGSFFFSCDTVWS